MLEQRVGAATFEIVKALERARNIFRGDELENGLSDEFLTRSAHQMLECGVDLAEESVGSTHRENRSLRLEQRREIKNRLV